MELRYAVLTHNIVSMRAEPDGRAEQVSQAILGENVVLLDERNEFALIRTPDEYEGWALRSHLRPHDPARPVEEQFWPLGPTQSDSLCVLHATVASLTREPGQSRTTLTQLVVGTWVKRVETDRLADGRQVYVRIPAGSEAGSETLLYGYVDACALENAAVVVTQYGYESGQMATLAQRFIGTPYLWGGTTPFGFDCSGFVQRLYSLCGVTLPRDAYMQAQSPLGSKLPEGEPLRAGDLVFFCGRDDPRKRGITHVGMMLDDREVIHAYSREGVITTPRESSLFRDRYTYWGAWRMR